MTPRPYQIEALQAIWQGLQNQNCVLLEACCSAGKTLIFSKIIKRLLAEQPGFRVLVLMDREILVRQTEEKLRKVAPELALDIGIVCSSVSKTKDHGKRVTIASRQTLINRMDDFEPVQLLVIDEAHLVAIPEKNIAPKSQFGVIIEKLFQYNPNMRMLAVTATPYRLAGGYIYGGNNVKNSEPYFSDVTHRITVEKLEKLGYLAPLIGYTTAPDSMSTDLESIRLTAGEYNLGELSDVMSKSVHINSAVETWKEYCIDPESTKMAGYFKRKKTLAFCVDIEHSELLAQAFNDAGIPAVAIHSRLSEIDNSLAMEALETGTKKVFCSVAKLTTGMDVIDIDCILLCRPTKSAALYKQMLGRGQRLNAETHPHKKNCLVLDMVGNNDAFGTNLDNLTVKYVGQGNGEKKNSDDMPVKYCPTCNTELHPACRICSECNYEFPKEYSDAEKPGMQQVDYGVSPPVNMDIIDMFPQVWESKNSGKTLLRVSFELKESFYSTCSASIWLCFPEDNYHGFAIERGQEQWKTLTNNTDYPLSAEEAMERWNEVITPEKAVVNINDRWPEIIGFEHDDIPF